MSNKIELKKSELRELFEIKYGNPDATGWTPRRNLKFGYYHPGDIYEATIRKLVNENTRWIDVGGGRALFPHNKSLSEMLSKQCKKLVAVDPSPNIFENPYAHEKSMSMIEDYKTNNKFDLATFRMVAEHIDNPEAVLKKLRELLDPEGIVVIYTINKFSPIPIITFFTPFSIHFKIKKIFWGGDEKDTFPVAYKMNTRKDLYKTFNAHGFSEESFRYLDDLSTFAKFKFANLLELILWKGLKILKTRYPENNLLGIYKKKA